MAKSKLRKQVEKKVYGKCKTCGRTNTPLHTCRLRFTEVNARNVKKRQGLCLSNRVYLLWNVYRRYSPPIRKGR